MTNEPKKLKILIAEYGYTSRMQLAKIFTELGHDFQIITDGTQVVPLYLEHSFDILFLDNLMAKKGAIEVTESLLEVSCKSPIIALSANLQPGELQNYLDVGMVDCISKPYKIEIFDSIIKKYS